MCKAEVELAVVVPDQALHPAQVAELHIIPVHLGAVVPIHGQS
jgi:hypothetical protein